MLRSASRVFVAAGLWAALLATFGCASDQATINRVQNEGAIRKSMLTEGEWYTHTTVIDTDYGSLTFVGDGDAMQRVRFEIQKDHLIARRTNEFVRGSEGSEGTAGKVETTAVIAMYRILSHFDAKHDYNPVTGERQNVIEENTTDRPWSEREFMRVDWSQNLIEDVQFSVTGDTGGIQLTSVPFWDDGESEADFPDYAPVFARDERGNLEYFDVVTRYFAEPAQVTLQNADGSTWSVASCLLILGMHQDCAPGHIWARRAFWRVQDRDYEPAVYSADRMDRAGFFLTVRDGYDRDYGLTRYNRMRFIKRHNIWERSHRRDEDNKLYGCENDEHCGGGGSRCDFGYQAAYGGFGVCTIPYIDREIRHVPYYLSERFPEELIGDAEALVADWDRAFRATVRSLRRIDCEEYGSDCGRYAPEPEGYTARDEERVVVLCHNPVRDDDHAACGEPGTVARIGDLRYNLVAWVDEPHASSPLGFGPSESDPFTGEIINASAFVYGASVDAYASQARDIVALLRGDLTEEQIESNDEYLTWIASVEDVRAREERSAREADHHVIDLDGDDAHRAAASADFGWLRERLAHRLPRRGGGAAELPERIAEIKRALGDIGADMALAQKGRAAIKSLVGTPIEDLMIGDEAFAMAGLAPPSLVPGQTLSGAQLDRFSPLRGQSIEGLSQTRDQKRMLQLGRRHCVLERDFADGGLLGLARAIDRAADNDKPVRWYGQAYSVGRGGLVDYDAVREMVRHPIFHAVMQHEVGHTLGLRHNFSGSYDAVNYSPRYWELRDDDNVAPRAWDPMTSREINGRIREYQYSSVMDYGHNFVVTDAEGIGHYDTAAIKLGYGDLVEVFTKVPSGRVAQVANQAVQASYGLLANLDVGDDGSQLRFLPYTEWPKVLGGRKNLEARRDVPYTSLRAFESLLGGRLPALTPEGEPAVPYKYCGDEFADFMPDCLRYDAGADPYESLQSVIDAYWEYYPFSHFMRQRITFDSDSVPARNYNRFFSKLEAANRIYAFYRALFDDIMAGEPNEATFAEDLDGLGALTLGVRASFDLFRRIVATPEPDSYVLAERADGSLAYLRGRGDDSRSVGSFEGRFLRTGFDFGPDFSWIFFDRAGYFHDKTLAIEVLTHAEASFVGQDTDADVRRFSTSFYTTFPEESNELLRGLIASDWSTFAPRLDGRKLVYPRFDEVQSGGAGMAGEVLDPNFDFSLQMFAMVYASAYIPNAFDQNFTNKARIFVKGGAEAVDLAVPLVEWTDPQSGLTYQAGSYVDGDGVERGIGASMLAWAESLEAAGYSGELADWVDNIDIMRWLTTVVGTGQPALTR